LKAVRPGELKALAFSFFYFLLLLSSYYVLRPVRDSLVAGLGVEEIKYLVLVVFLAMLAVAPIFGALMTHFPRRRLLPAIYAFFVVNLLLFAIAFATPSIAAWTARVFYVWLTVFNFFVVSLFWSFMADIWREEQGRRLFGAIAAGGSIGGLLGPELASSLAKSAGISGLTLLSALLLSGTVVCMVILGRIAHSQDGRSQADALSGSSLEGLRLVARSPFLLGISGIILIAVIVAQFAYAETARMAKELIDTPEARTVFYANVDYWTNVTTLILQAIVVGLLTARFGVVAPLLGMVLVGCISFIVLAVSPLLSTLAVTNVARRAAEYGIGKPGRDMLYTVATPQEKYLGKNVVDTVISRGGDFVGGWFYSAATTLGMTLSGLSWLAAAAMVGATFVVLTVVRQYHARGGK
jgi:AAA family ATP:ADP antiporter